MQRKVNVVEDLDGNKIVFIHDVKFKGKRSIAWTDVEEYLKQFVGKSYVIENTNDMVYIGTDFPDEYAHSEYTTSLKGANAKAKANAFGWYRYGSRFALPVYEESGEVVGYNVFNVIMVVRHAQDGKLYLYDIVNIKKETSNLFQS